MRFETKVAIVIQEDLAGWQKLNVTAFVSSGVATGVEGIIGAPYEDGSGNRYLAMLRQPVLVFSGNAGAIRAAFDRNRQLGLKCAVYTDEMFGTDNDVDNRAAVRRVDYADLKLAGFAVYGPRNQVDKVLKGLPLHG